MRKSILAIVVGFVLLAQPSAVLPSASAQDLGTGSLYGLVCTHSGYALDDPPSGSQEGCFGHVLPGATVTVERGGVAGDVGAISRTATSDDSGAYHVGDLPDGQYTVTFSRPGFQTEERAVTVAAETELSMSLAGQIIQLEGRIRSAEGNAIVGATISFSGPSQAKHQSISDGIFGADILAGWYYVEAFADGFAPHQEELLLDGQKEYRITMQRGAGETATVSGSVRDQNGDPVAGATINIYSSRPYSGGVTNEGDGQTEPQRAMVIGHPYGGANRTMTAADGTYRFNVAPGFVNIAVSKAEHRDHYEGFEVEDRQNVEKDITLKKFPPRTAHIVGRIVDAATGAAVTFSSLNLQNREFGTWDCSHDDSTQRDIAHEPARGCNIQLRADGTFEGNVTPGYTTMSAYHEHWKSCTETRDADGSSRRSCGPEYMRWVRTLVLPENARTEVVIELRQRPAADATISGYAVDGTTQQAIPGANINLYSDETSSYGWATTDGHGSYKIGLRSGWHYVSVWAEGYYGWEGMVRLAAGEDRSFDIVLTPGQDDYCCYAIATPASAEGGQAEATQDSSGRAVAGGQVAPGAPQVDQGSDDESAQTYQDFGGGLGPYDPNARRGVGSAEEDTAETPAAPVGAIAVGVLAAVAVARRLRRD